MSEKKTNVSDNHHVLNSKNSCSNFSHAYRNYILSVKSKYFVWVRLQTSSCEQKIKLYILICGKLMSGIYWNKCTNKLKNYDHGNFIYEFELTCVSHGQLWKTLCFPSCHRKWRSNQTKSSPLQNKLSSV